MAGGSYIDPYPRGEPCNEHSENVAIICPSETTCFGEPVPDLVRRVCNGIDDYGDSINTRENGSAMELLEASRPKKDHEREKQRDSERRLLTHSLWLIDHQTLLDDTFWTPLCYQVRNLPDESKVYTWVSNNHDDFEEIKSNINTQFTNVKIASTQEDIEDWIYGYLAFQVNPNGSEQTVIEWSHKVAEKIDDIR